MNSKHRVSVCVAIPTYNREWVLVETIKQVLVQRPPADEILVIDQTPQHELETESYLTSADKIGQIRWVKHYPPNLPGARNRALAESKCDVTIFIDDDVELSSGFIENHLQNYSDLEVDAVAGRTIQPTGYRYPKRQISWPTLMDYKYIAFNSAKRKVEIAAFPGGNHSVRTIRMREIGGYDENFVGWAYREDSDAAIRIWKYGGVIVFDPKAELIHLAVPGGGCRIKTLEKRIPEWQVSFPSTYFACRHLFPSLEFWKQIMFMDIRKYVLRKDTVFHPWRLPVAVFSYAFGIIRSVYLVRGPIKSPFICKWDQ